MARHSRNDKCWCGQDRKYKKCCWPQLPIEGDIIDIGKGKTFSNTQPIRVLNNYVVLWFEKCYPDFISELKDAVDNNGLVKAIRYDNGEVGIDHPAQIGINKQIRVEETFLSYLWIICYALMVIFDEGILKPRLRKSHDKLMVEEAYKLFRCGLTLRKRYSVWAKELPNPECYDLRHKYYIERANSAFLSAVNFILCHELGHLKLGHLDKLFSRKQNLTSQELVKEESDADSFAIKTVLKGATTKQKRRNIEYGVIAALCALVFFDRNLKKDEYPDSDIRIKMALEHLNLKDTDNYWGVASLALKIWSTINSAKLELPPVVDTYKQCFYLIIKELKKTKL